MRQNARYEELYEFPGYAITEEGRVLSPSNNELKLMKNQQGIVMVGMMFDGRQQKRAVAPMVARCFLEQHRNPRFNTPIHLNGDKSDCRAKNLAWRPRWFAIKYHMQFKDPTCMIRVPIICLDTNEVFPNSWEAAIRYGMLDKDIHLGIMNQELVFPLGYEFEVYDQE